MFLTRYYKVPAHVVRSWTPDELALNWVVALRAQALYTQVLKDTEFAVCAIQLSPLG